MGQRVSFIVLQEINNNNNNEIKQTNKKKIG